MFSASRRSVLIRFPFSWCIVEGARITQSTPHLVSWWNNPNSQLHSRKQICILHRVASGHVPYTWLPDGNPVLFAQQRSRGRNLRYSSKKWNLWYGHPCRRRLYLPWWLLLVCGRSGTFEFALKVWQVNPRFTSAGVISYCLLWFVHAPFAYVGNRICVLYNISKWRL